MLVGVIHLPPLPGSPRSALSMRACIDRARVDAAALREAGGFDAVIVENFGDTPFFRAAVPQVTIAAMTACCLAVREELPELPLGVNVLRNDGLGALSVAVAASASFVRVNVLTSARVTDQGLIEGRAAELLRERRSLGATSVAVWADVDVKHSAPLGERPLRDEVEDVVARAMADVVLVTGEGTGKAVDVTRLAAVREATTVPVLVASGATVAALPTLSSLASGVVVGSALRASGRAGDPIDVPTARAFSLAYAAAFRR